MIGKFLKDVFDDVYQSQPIQQLDVKTNTQKNANFFVKCKTTVSLRQVDYKDHPTITSKGITYK